MSGDDQLASDRAVEVRWQLIAAAVDDILFLIRGLRQSRQTVDDELLAAVTLSAITVTPQSSREEAMDFWRNYAALIVALKPHPDEAPLPTLAVSRPTALVGLAAPDARVRHFAGSATPLIGGAVAPLRCALSLLDPIPPGEVKRRPTKAGVG